jgi:hypothetical protein
MLPTAPWNQRQFRAKDSPQEQHLGIALDSILRIPVSENLRFQIARQALENRRPE